MDTPPLRTVYLVKRAQTVVRGGLETCLQPRGVTPRQYITLSLLREERDQSWADLARKTGITPQSMSETTATLIRKGLIERLENFEHRRILMARLTGKGKALLAECDVAVDVLESRLPAGTGARDLETLRQTLWTIDGSGLFSCYLPRLARLSDSGRIGARVCSLKAATKRSSNWRSLSASFGEKGSSARSRARRAGCATRSSMS